MRKAQGSLEYLIIVAAVLAIAAVVVLFLSGAFKGTGGGGAVSVCKSAASQCALSKQTTSNYNCTTSCMAACTTSAGFDAKASTVTPGLTTCTSFNGGAPGNTATDCAMCADGNTTGIN